MPRFNKLRSGARVGMKSARAGAAHQGAGFRGLGHGLRGKTFHVGGKYADNITHRNYYATGYKQGMGVRSQVTAARQGVKGGGLFLGGSVGVLAVKYAYNRHNKTRVRSHYRARPGHLTQKQLQQRRNAARKKRRG